MSEMNEKNIQNVVFSFHNYVCGNGFFAKVHIDGWAILYNDWIYGVFPGCLSGNLHNFENFKEGWISILYDLAYDASSYKDFKSKVLACTNNTCNPNLELFNNKLKKIEEVKGKLSLLKPSLEVTKLISKKCTPSLNTLDFIQILY